MHSTAANAYSQTARNVGTPRSIELQAFQRTTARLQAALAPETPFMRLAEAVHLNSKLWILLAGDLMSSQNALPKDLRAQLLQLAEFSRRHGLNVLGGNGDPRDLIEINTAVMRGLRDAAPAAQAAASQTVSGVAESAAVGG